MCEGDLDVNGRRRQDEATVQNQWAQVWLAPGDRQKVIGEVCVGKKIVRGVGRVWRRFVLS